MSEREQLQAELVTFLSTRNFNAPFGIIPNLRKIGKGYVREVTFGKARTLDCTVTIWSKKRITVDARGPFSQYLARNYKSLDELKIDLEVMT